MELKDRTIACYISRQHYSSLIFCVCVTRISVFSYFAPKALVWNLRFTIRQTKQWYAHLRNYNCGGLVKEKYLAIILG